jgi:hypothetical protein
MAAVQLADLGLVKTFNLGLQGIHIGAQFLHLSNDTAGAFEVLVNSLRCLYDESGVFFGGSELVDDRARSGIDPFWF